MPLREVHAKFTKSELVIMAWRSSEVAYNLKTRPGVFKVQQDDNNGLRPSLVAKNDIPGQVQDDELRAIEERLGPIAYKLGGEGGKVDLRKLTGEEALQFFSAFGIHIPRFERNK